jgi:hypothetical protein
MTEFLQYLDYYLVAAFKAGKRRLKYYVISQSQGVYMLERDEAAITIGLPVNVSSG